MKMLPGRTYQGSVSEHCITGFNGALVWIPITDQGHRANLSGLAKLVDVETFWTILSPH